MVLKSQAPPWAALSSKRRAPDREPSQPREGLLRPTERDASLKAAVRGGLGEGKYPHQSLSPAQGQRLQIRLSLRSPRETGVG